MLSASFRFLRSVWGAGPVLERDPEPL